MSDSPDPAGDDHHPLGEDDRLDAVRSVRCGPHAVRITVVQHWHGNWTAHADVGGRSVGYATFKRGSNDYVSGDDIYRIGNVSVFVDEYRGNGIYAALIDAFEAGGRTVIPSGAFGAEGRLTEAGFAAARKRLSQTPPPWLPLGWEQEFEFAVMEDGEDDEPEADDADQDWGPM